VQVGCVALQSCSTVYVCNSFEDAADIRTLEMWRRKPDPLGANLGKFRGADDDLHAPKLCLQIETCGALHNIVPPLPGDNLKVSAYFFGCFDIDDMVNQRAINALRWRTLQQVRLLTVGL
jgi:hypothetical protein